MGVLTAVHLLLCGAALVVHLSRYPLEHSLYYWWFTPLDLAAILMVTPLYLAVRPARFGYCLNWLISGLETMALVYLGMALLNMAPASNAPVVTAWAGATLVAARIPVGWAIANCAPVVSGRPRGCAA